jgi:hypothetical protein
VTSDAEARRVANLSVGGPRWASPLREDFASCFVRPAQEAERHLIVRDEHRGKITDLEQALAELVSRARRPVPTQQIRNRCAGSLEVGPPTQDALVRLRPIRGPCHLPHRLVTKAQQVPRRGGGAGGLTTLALGIDEAGPAAAATTAKSDLMCRSASNPARSGAITATPSTPWSRGCSMARTTVSRVSERRLEMLTA